MTLSFAGTAGQPIDLLVQPGSALSAFADSVTIIEPDGQTQLFSQATNLNTGQQSLLTGLR